MGDDAPIALHHNTKSQSNHNHSNHSAHLAIFAMIALAWAHERAILLPCHEHGIGVGNPRNPLVCSTT